ncbi:MAG: TatD family hydrolase [Candidatus Micrarchaeia archaeon]
MFSDSHCHLYMVDNKDELLERCDECDVGLLLNTGVDIESASIVSNDVFRGVYGVIGISPDFAKIQESNTEKLLDIFKKSKSKIVGIGEIGLDNKTDTLLEIQIRVFEKQLEIAERLKLPVIIHSRNMLQKVEEILYEKNVKKVMFHFFEGNEVDAKRIEKKGYLISIPPLEYSRFKRIINTVDLESIVCETDMPAVGKTPCDVLKTVEKIAKIKNREVTQVGENITETIKAYFDI